MEKGASNGHLDQKSELYFDLKVGKIIGGLALKDSAVPNLLDPTIVNLSEYLHDHSKPIDQEAYPRLNTTDWNKKDFLKNGRWLSQVAGPPQSAKSLTARIIHRGWSLGLSSSLDSIRHPDRFGSLSNFQKTLGLTDEIRRPGNFDDWSRDDFIRHIKRIGDEEGTRPTIAIIRRRIKDGKVEPSPKVIREKFGSLHTAYELGGFVDPRIWGTEEYIDWGVKLLRANGGIDFTAKNISYLSKLGRGPGYNGIKSRFESLNEFKDVVRQEFDNQESESLEFYEEKLSEIEFRLERNTLPSELFDGCQTEDDMIFRYAKFLVLEDLLTDGNLTSKISIASEGNKSVKELGFIRSIKRVNGAITSGDVESSALYLGLFDYLWPMDSYMEDLRLPDEMLIRRYGNKKQKIAA